MMKPLNEQSALEVRLEKAVRRLLDLALDQDSRQAKIAADVLLSAAGMHETPGQRWRVDLGDLSILSDAQAFAALGVIHARASLKICPSTTIARGPALLQALRNRWLNVEDW